MTVQTGIWRHITCCWYFCNFYTTTEREWSILHLIFRIKYQRKFRRVFRRLGKCSCKPDWGLDSYKRCSSLSSESSSRLHIKLCKHAHHLISRMLISLFYCSFNSMLFCLFMFILHFPVRAYAQTCIRFTSFNRYAFASTVSNISEGRTTVCQSVSVWIWRPPQDDKKTGLLTH